MKPSAKWVFSFVVGVAFFYARFAAAHGDHFHSLGELAQHIRGHLAELEQIQARPRPNLQLIQEECREIETHARQYQDFARQIHATELEKLSADLIKTARGNDLVNSILLLKKMDACLPFP